MRTKKGDIVSLELIFVYGHHHSPVRSLSPSVSPGPAASSIGVVTPDINTEYIISLVVSDLANGASTCTFLPQCDRGAHSSLSTQV